MTAPVPQAAVDAAMKAMDCKRVGDSELGHWCYVHQFVWPTDIDSCPRAKSVAAAVVAAVQGPIKAEAWDEGVRRCDQAWHDGDAISVFDRNPYRDRIEAQR